jgi:hypothetical protein
MFNKIYTEKAILFIYTVTACINAVPDNIHVLSRRNSPLNRGISRGKCLKCASKINACAVDLLYTIYTGNQYTSDLCTLLGRDQRPSQTNARHT